MTALTNETRKLIVRDVSVSEETRGSIGYPPEEAFKGKEQPEKVWLVRFRIQEGLLPETTIWTYQYSQKEADDMAAKHPVGSEYPGYFPFKSIEFDDWVKSGFFPISAGSDDLYLPWKVLWDAGITDNGLHTSQKVLDSLGSERVQKLKELYEDNWSVVAEFEYCFRQLSHSSPAYLAAAARFCYYILADDFKAGYLLRDLEVLVHGVEAEATKAIEKGKKAGASGSKKSKQARESRRNLLFAKIETLAERSPDILKFGADAVAKLALQECIEESPVMWRQGAGQVAEYLGEIRRGEAGSELQKRYQALFGSKPPKRF